MHYRTLTNSLHISLNGSHGRGTSLDSKRSTRAAHHAKFKGARLVGVGVLGDARGNSGIFGRRWQNQHAIQAAYSNGIPKLAQFA